MNNIDRVPQQGFTYAARKIAGQGFAHSRRTVKATESLDKFSKFVSAILKGLEYFGIDKIYPPLKNVRVNLDGFSKTVGAFNILGRISEAATGFYKTPNHDATWKGFDFKRVSRGFLFAGHAATTGAWVLNLASLGRYAGHFVANTSFRLLPGVTFFADIPIFISAVLGVVASCLTLHRTNERDVKEVEVRGKKRVEMVATRLSKWDARKALLETMKSSDANKASKIEKLKQQYLSARIKLSGEGIKETAARKWAVLVDQGIFNNNDQRESGEKLTNEKTEHYRHETIKLANTRHKSIVAIIYDLFKAAIIALAVTAAVLTAVAVTLPFSLAPAFVVLGLFTAGSGLWKAFIDNQSNKDNKKRNEFRLKIPQTIGITNHYKALFVAREAARVA